jgi:HK97 family phage prohead protease
MERLTFAASGKVEGRTLSGTAHVYGNVTTDGRKHSFAPGAFARSVAAGRLVSFAHHEDTMLLGSQVAGTLRLTDGDEFGYALDLPETTYGNDLRVLAERGEPLGMSFAIMPGGKYVKQDGVKVWTDVDLISVDPVALPAFGGTSVILNSATESVETSRATAIRLRHKLALK